MERATERPANWPFGDVEYGKCTYAQTNANGETCFSLGVDPESGPVCDSCQLRLDWPRVRPMNARHVINLRKNVELRREEGANTLGDYEHAEYHLACAMLTILKTDRQLRKVQDSLHIAQDLLRP